MKHFIEISQLTKQEILWLIQRAIEFKNDKTYPSFPLSPVVNLFYENSTRTRVSFELAAKHLGMPVINLDLQSSSEAKGEIIDDTISTLTAMGIKVFIVRHKQDGILQRLAEHTQERIAIINAGDGMHAHPTQAMLDLMTIIEKKPNISELKVAIIGDIRHSRVANSLQVICSKLGIGELTLVAPSVWQPTTVHFGRVTDSLQDGIEDADVVICLRVQRERLLSSEHMDLDSYRDNYALNLNSLNYAKPDAIVMHPGPMNRSVEIDSDVADGAQSCILQQVGNGVFMRMAVLEFVLR